MSTNLNYDSIVKKTYIPKMEGYTERFEELKTEYSGIITDLQEKGWIGDTNTNFVTKNHEYKANLEKMLTNLKNLTDELKSKSGGAEEDLEGSI